MQTTHNDLDIEICVCTRFYTIVYPYMEYGNFTKRVLKLELPVRTRNTETVGRTSKAQSACWPYKYSYRLATCML